MIIITTTITSGQRILMKGTDTQTTLHVTSVAIGRIYAIHAMWSNNVTILLPNVSGAVKRDFLIFLCQNLPSLTTLAALTNKFTGYQ